MVETDRVVSEKMCFQVLSIWFPWQPEYFMVDHNLKVLESFGRNWP